MTRTFTPRRLGAVVTVMAVVLIGLGPSPARAASTAIERPATLSWSVQPVPAPGADPRTSYFLSVREGQTLTDTLRIRNFGQNPLPLRVYATDARTTDTGSTELLPASERPADVGAWITLERGQVIVPPQGSVDVTFTMRVPREAEPGDHTGGIVTSYLAPGRDRSGESVTLDRRLAVRVAVRVEGKLRPALAISNLMATYVDSPNPVGDGSMRLRYSVTNTGNVRLGADQVVRIEGPLAMAGQTATLERLPELLPGNTVTVQTEVSGVWPTVRSSVDLELSPVPTRPGEDFKDLSAARAATNTWSPPWSLLALLMLISTVSAGLLLGRRRAQERERERIAEAVEGQLRARGIDLDPSGSPDPDPRDHG